jgi:hypothetical protein
MRLARSVGLAAVGTLRKPLSLGTLRVHLLQALETGPDSVSRPAAAFSVTADDVAAAIANGDIAPAYQPKIELATRRIAGVEALARWTSAEHGRVPPGVFVDIAERRR